MNNQIAQAEKAYLDALIEEVEDLPPAAQVGIPWSESASIDDTTLDN